MKQGRGASIWSHRVKVGAAAVALGLGISLVNVSSAQAYNTLGCKWSSSSVRLYVPSPLLSYPVWWNAAANWNGLDAKYVSASTTDVYGTNENRGNTVSWTGVTRAKGTLQSFPPCSGGRWTTGRMEVVLNWSLISSLGYSSAKRQGVAAHELGHAFGLAHNSASTGILMYPYDSRTTYVPASDDKAGVNALY